MTRFYPMLDTPTTKYTVQPGLGFLAPEYLRSTGSQHESADFNAVTGGDTDLGDSVYAMQGGTVTAAFWHPGIGGIILIAHPEGDEAHYWHMRDIHVRKGQYVNAGDLIGQVGKGGKGQWFAHAHIGIRRKAGVLAADYWPSTHHKDPKKCAEFINEHYEDVQLWLKRHGAKRRIEDLQSMRNPPTRVLVGDEEITGQLMQFPANGVTVDARGPTVRVYVNDPHVGQIPAQPEAK